MSAPEHGPWEGAPCPDVLAETGLDLWWPDEDGTYADAAAAIKICRTCPLQTPCTAEGIAQRADTGIWGGAKFRRGLPLLAIGART